MLGQVKLSNNSLYHMPLLNTIHKMGMLPGGVDTLRCRRPPVAGAGLGPRSRFFFGLITVTVDNKVFYGLTIRLTIVV